MCLSEAVLASHSPLVLEESLNSYYQGLNSDLGCNQAAEDIQAAECLGCNQAAECLG